MRRPSSQMSPSSLTVAAGASGASSGSVNPAFLSNVSAAIAVWPRAAMETRSSVPPPSAIRKVLSLSGRSPSGNVNGRDVASLVTFPGRPSRISTRKNSPLVNVLR